MKQGNQQKNKLKSIRVGLRLNTPAPKIIKHAKDYNRKEKHKITIREMV
jgi:hypothetical protein